MLSVAKTDSVWDSSIDLALQRKMAEFGVRKIVVEELNGPINDDDCIVLMFSVLNKCLDMCEDECL